MANTINLNWLPNSSTPIYDQDNKDGNRTVGAVTAVNFDQVDLTWPASSTTMTLVERSVSEVGPYQTEAWDEAGVHTITFNAVDAAGNSVTSSRSLTVSQTAKVNTAPISQNVSITIPETTDIGAVIGSVSGIDNEGDTVSYSITAGNTNGDFAINSITGVITLVNRLNFLTLDNYSLSISVSDGQVSTAVTATIAVLQVLQAVVLEQYTFTNFEVA